MDLSEIRIQIDKVDQQIVELFQRRMELGEEVAKSKRNTGKPIYDKEREDQKIAKLIEYADNDFNKKAIAELFLQLMSISRRYQYSLIGDVQKYATNRFSSVKELAISESTKVVYQGVRGAYSDQCVQQFFGDRVDRFHVVEFEDVMKTLESGEADYGVLPIENSSSGTVVGIYELLDHYDNLCVVGEEIVKVDQTLLGIPGATKEDITTVYSHVQGLIQSSKYLKQYPWQQIEVSNTAYAAKKVAEEGLIHQAAISSERAGEIYGLEVLEKTINHESHNSTRFIILSNKKVFCEEASKVSISFSLKHETGSLYNMLANFIYNDLSLNHIESRPLPNKQWEYRFFVDFLGNLNDSAVQNALMAIREEASELRIIGNYK